MAFDVLFPFGSRLHLARASRRAGPDELTVKCGRRDRAGRTSERVLQAVGGSVGLELTGRITVRIEPDIPDGPTPALDFPIALAALGSMPRNAKVRQRGVVAHGLLDCHGAVGAAVTHSLPGLGAHAFVGRFWDAALIPDPGDRSVLTLIDDVTDLDAAWAVVVSLKEVERSLRREWGWAG